MLSGAVHPGRHHGGWCCLLMVTRGVVTIGRHLMPLVTTVQHRGGGGDKVRLLLLVTVGRRLVCELPPGQVRGGAVRPPAALGGARGAQEN